jgi:hypothetical protein
MAKRKRKRTADGSWWESLPEEEINEFQVEEGAIDEGVPDTVSLEEGADQKKRPSRRIVQSVGQPVRRSTFPEGLNVEDAQEFGGMPSVDYAGDERGITDRITDMLAGEVAQPVRNLETIRTRARDRRDRLSTDRDRIDFETSPDLGRDRRNQVEELINQAGEDKDILNSEEDVKEDALIERLMDRGYEYPDALRIARRQKRSY